MEGNSKKRSAEEAVEDGDEELPSPSNKRSTGDDDDESSSESPSNKRSTGVDDDDDDEDEASGEQATEEQTEEPSEQPKSPAGNENNTEPNLSPAGSDNDAGEEEENGGDDAEIDADDDADDDDDEMEENPPPTKKSINVAGKPAEAGVIKTIYVENFMCHQKLRVELCRNVNFINGQNGSGKSAILAAIQICLGAGARRTNRARNLKELVRKEAAGNNPNTSAKVRVTLVNEGGDGYKQELYGNEITIERSIALRGGYNGYRLLNAEKKEVSRCKKELEEMLDHLNIQVENPVAILDQEEAKKFLKGKAEDKYNFFLKATELERIDATYRKISEKRHDLDAQHDRLIDSLESKKAKVLALQQKVNEFKAVEILQKKRLGLQIGFAWSFFGERNRDHQEKQDKLIDFQERSDAKQLELTQAEEEASGANDTDEEQRIKDRMEELQKEAGEQALLKRDLEANLKHVLQPVKIFQRDIKSAEKEKKTADKSVARAKQRLKEARDEIMAKSGSAESEEARRTALLSETEEALAQAKAASDGMQEAVAVSFRQYEEMEPEGDQAKQTASTKAKQFEAVKKKVRELKSSSANDSVAIFGQNCSKLHKLVESAKQQGRFRGEVLGPIGAFIKIAPGKEKYAELAEMAVGFNSLDRFIVTNDHDRKLCESYRATVGCGKQCGLFQVQVSPRFTIPPPAAADIETVASVLTVDNDIVFNCLVDNSRIDQRALAPSKEISEQRLLANANGRYSIRGNINEVTFLPNGDKWTVRDGAISLSSNDRRSGDRRIGVDRTRAIEEAEKDLRVLDAEMKEANTTAKDVSTRSFEKKRVWNDHIRAERKHKDKIEKLTQKKEDITLEMETTANTTIDTSELEEDVSQAEEELEKVKGKETSLKKQLEEHEPGVDDARAKLEEIQTRNGRVLEDMKAAENKLESCINRISQNESQLQKKRDKMKKYTEIVQQHSAQVEKAADERGRALLAAKKLALRQKYKEEQADAEAGGASLETTRDFTEEELEQVEIMEVSKDSKSYEAKISRISDKITKELERRALSNEDPSEATEEYFKERQNLFKTQASVEEVKDMQKKLDRDLRERMKRCGRMRKHLSQMTDSRFDHILRLNNSCGEVHFDDEKHELNLVVQKDKDDASSQTKDVKALSGGERSYTTISLLLALGESLETPFRVLDEFDVFLDSQARKLTIKTLIHVAKKMQHRQFIFITPQDLSSVTPEPNRVKIFKMKAPQRNQIAGGPTQQTLECSQT